MQILIMMKKYLIENGINKKKIYIEKNFKYIYN